MGKVLHLDSVDSTNTYARNHFDELEDGTLVVTYRQTAGRGRRGRAWISPPDTNLAVTMIMKQLRDGFHAGCIAGLGTLACVRSAAPELAPFLKWPNDVYLEDRKLAGILCEGAKAVGGRLTGVVAGIGLNVNLPPELLEQIDQPATSLFAAAKTQFNLDFLSKKLAETLFRYYIVYLNNADSVVREWREKNLLTGETVTVVDAGGRELTGVFAAIGDDGAMKLDTGAETIDFRCGDVKIDRNSIRWDRLKVKARNRNDNQESR